MKNFLIATFFLFVATIVTHADPVHLGTSNKYSIGNKDIPAKVYFLFLQAKADGEALPLWSSKYYESSFMKAPSGMFNSYWNNNKDCIQQTASTAHYCYMYSLIPGHEEDIIDALSSQEVQQEFNNWYANWLKNPSWSEVCDYINDKLKAHFDNSYEALADAIAQKYPDAFSFSSFSNDMVYANGSVCWCSSNNFSHANLGEMEIREFYPTDSSGNIFHLVDVLVDIIYNGATGEELGLQGNYSHFTCDCSKAKFSEGYVDDRISFSAVHDYKKLGNIPPVVATLSPSNNNDLGWQREDFSIEFLAVGPINVTRDFSNASQPSSSDF